MKHFQMQENLLFKRERSSQRFYISLFFLFQQKSFYFKQVQSIKIDSISSNIDSNRFNRFKQIQSIQIDSNRFKQIKKDSNSRFQTGRISSLVFPNFFRFCSFFQISNFVHFFFQFFFLFCPFSPFSQFVHFCNYFQVLNFVQLFNSFKFSILKLVQFELLKIVNLRFRMWKTKKKF